MLPAFATVLRATKAPLLPSIRSDDIFRNPILPPPATYVGNGAGPCNQLRSPSPSSGSSSSSETSVSEGLVMISRFLDGKEGRPVREMKRNFDGSRAHPPPISWVQSSPQMAERASNVSDRSITKDTDKKNGVLERAVLRDGIERLQLKLPKEGKERLAEAIRCYLRSQISPEAFAEELSHLAQGCRASAHRGEKHQQAPSHRPASSPAGEQFCGQVSSRASKRLKSQSGMRTLRRVPHILLPNQPVPLVSSLVLTTCFLVGVDIVHLLQAPHRPAQPRPSRRARRRLSAPRPPAGPSLPLSLRRRRTGPSSARPQKLRRPTPPSSPPPTRSTRPPSGSRRGMARRLRGRRCCLSAARRDDLPRPDQPPGASIRAPPTPPPHTHSITHFLTSWRFDFTATLAGTMPPSRIHSTSRLGSCRGRRTSGRHAGHLPRGAARVPELHRSRESMRDGRSVGDGG